MAGLSGNGIRLTGGFGDIVFNKIDDIGSNRSLYDFGKRNPSTVGGHVGLQGLNGDEGTSGGHFCEIGVQRGMGRLGFWARRNRFLSGSKYRCYEEQGRKKMGLLHLGF